jgi:hypothetical protein
MRKFNERIITLVILPVALVLGACQPVILPTPAPPTATAAPSRTPGPRLATRLEDILGIWQASGIFYRFNQDGTYTGAFSLDSLEAETERAHFEGEFWFEGTQLFLRELKAVDVTPCGDKTASYQVQLLENGHLKFTASEDACPWRYGALVGELYAPER